MKIGMNFRTFSIHEQLSSCNTWPGWLQFSAFLTYSAFWVISNSRFPSNATMRTAFPLDSFVFKLLSCDGKSITWLLSVDRIKNFAPLHSAKLSMYGFSIVETGPNRKSFVSAFTGCCIVIWSLRHHTTVLGIDADLLRGDILSCYGGLDSHLPKREWVMWCHTHVFKRQTSKAYFSGLFTQVLYDVTVLQTDDVTQPKLCLTGKLDMPIVYFVCFSIQLRRVTWH